LFIVLYIIFLKALRNTYVPKSQTETIVSKRIMSPPYIKKSSAILRCWQKFWKISFLRVSFVIREAIRSPFESTKSQV